MERKIDILMATYNGETFIKQQISSIQNQTFKDWVLYIHDDGSTDTTLAVIRDMASHDERIVLIEQRRSFGAPAVRGGTESCHGEPANRFRGGKHVTILTTAGCCTCKKPASL